MKLGFLHPIINFLDETALGKRYRDYVIQRLVDVDPDFFYRKVSRCHTQESGFSATLEKEAHLHTDTIEGFEDLTWLFARNVTNMGIIRLCLDEAAYLYRLIRTIPAARGAELGRLMGGSAFLMAAAMDEQGHLLSVDNHAKGLPIFKSFDAEFDQALKRYGLADRVEWIVADSAQVPFEPATYDFVFIDGDHSYEGVARDYHHWKRALKAGGHLLFDDADGSRPFTVAPDGLRGPLKLRKELEANESAYFKQVKIIGSLVHYVRTEISWETKKGVKDVEMASTIR